MLSGYSSYFNISIMFLLVILIVTYWFFNHPLFCNISKSNNKNKKKYKELISIKTIKKLKQKSFQIKTA
jgi:uncharacterized membrane protein